MRKLLNFFVFAVLVVAFMVSALKPAEAATTAGTCTVTVENRAALSTTLPSYVKSGLQMVTFTWTSNSSGAVTNNDAVVYGKIVKVAFDPGDGATSPTANYDVTISDSLGSDLLLGLGANKSQSAVETLNFVQNSTIFSTTTLVQAVNTNNYFYPWCSYCFGTLTLGVTNAGASKQGVITLYVQAD